MYNVHKCAGAYCRLGAMYVEISVVLLGAITHVPTAVSYVNRRAIILLQHLRSKVRPAEILNRDH